MKFAQTLEREMIPHWREHYLDYGKLKTCIKAFSLKKEKVLRSSFNELVEVEVYKVQKFYVQQKSEIERSVVNVEHMKRIIQHEPRNRDLISRKETLLLEYHGLGNQLIELFHFLELNSTGLRKILKKFNKWVQNATGPTFLNMVTSSEESRLTDSLRQLQDYKLLEPIVKGVEVGILSLQRDLNEYVSETFTDESEDVEMSNRQYDARIYSNVPLIRYAQYTLQGSEIVQDLRGMREKMSQSSGFLAFISARSAIPFKHEFVRKQSTIYRQASTVDLLEVDGEQLLETEELYGEEADALSEYINLFSTFLYLCNYNMCLPTSAEYVQELGLLPAFSGVVVCMTPVAACISAVVYSYWSNFSFKNPLLCSSFLLVVGNLMYALAWDVRLTSWVLIGRFVCGLGGCRAINRRYIADHISIENRTRASAIFVAAGALGMSFGPFMAALFSDLEYTFMGLTFNEMTSPAFFMSGVWTVFGVFVVFFFKEPVIRQPTVVPDTAYKSSGSKRSRSFTDPEEDDESGFESSAEAVLLNKNKQPGYGTTPQRSYQAVKAEREKAAKKRKNKLITVFCCWAIFWVKLVQEALLTALSITVPDFYGWRSGRIGILMACLGVSVVPLNIFVVLLSQWYRVADDFWIKFLQVPIIIGCGVLISFSPEPPLLMRELLGMFTVFSAAQVIEGVVMSLFSKVISKKLAAGTFNSGLLATEAGTLGRAMGNAIITILGRGTSIDLQQHLYLFEGSVSVVTFLVSLYLIR